MGTLYWDQDHWTKVLQALLSRLTYHCFYASFVFSQHVYAFSPFFLFHGKIQLAAQWQPLCLGIYSPLIIFNSTGSGREISHILFQYWFILPAYKVLPSESWVFIWEKVVLVSLLILVWNRMRHVLLLLQHDQPETHRTFLEVPWSISCIPLIFHCNTFLNLPSSEEALCLLLNH